MGLFSKKNQALEDLLQTLRMDMENNYKDAAQADFVRVRQKYDDLKAAGQLKRKQTEYYDQVLAGLETELRNFTHKDQPARWDPNLPES